MYDEIKCNPNLFQVIPKYFNFLAGQISEIKNELPFNVLVWAVATPHKKFIWEKEIHFSILFQRVLITETISENLGNRLETILDILGNNIFFRT